MIPVFPDSKVALKGKKGLIVGIANENSIAPPPIVAAREHRPLRESLGYGRDQFANRVASLGSRRKP